MVARSELRKEAYSYILHILSNLPVEPAGSEMTQFVPLEELRLIKEGLADPTPALVALLKDLARDSISDIDIDAHLATPFAT
jgi:hypothetical protein